MSDDELSEEQQRKIEANLLGSRARKPIRVEVRRSGNKRPDPVELRFIDQLDGHDGEWMWTDVQQKASSGWIKLETFDNRKDAVRAYDKYLRGGDKVTWVEQRGGQFS